MSTFREQKRQARRQLHNELAEPVLYLSKRDAVPVRVTCRLHVKFEELGDLANVRVGFGDRQEVVPRIIFLNEQVKPSLDGYVITKDMGAYKLDNDAPPDDITTAVNVTIVAPGSAAKYGWDLSAPWCGFPDPEVI